MDTAVDLLPDGLELAPVWRRAAAGLINLLVVVAGLAVAGVAVFAAFKLGLTRRLTPAGGALSRKLDAWGERSDSSQKPVGLSAQTRLLISVPGLSLELDGRNRRGVGARAMGIRRVDVRTGGPVTFRAALIRHVVSNGYGLATGRLLRPITQRSYSRMQEFRPALRELQRVHADNPEALQEATSRFYRDHRVNPLASCLWPLLSGVVVRMLPFLLSPLRQSLPDRVARIVVVLDARSPSRRAACCDRRPGCDDRRTGFVEALSSRDDRSEF
jgi:hypothetical protein